MISFTYKPQNYDIIVSLSGGKTSAFLLKKLLEQGLKVLAVFMNTGLEHPRTYKFLYDMIDAWVFDYVILEARVFPTKNVGTGHKIVNFKDMHIGVEIARAVVEKYGLFGVGYLHCTREMKLQPFKSFKDKYYPHLETAIGIRVDEIDRMDAKAEENKIIYPLVKMNIRKQDVNNFFKNNPFTLEIPDYLGNCVGCWKKSNNKLIKVAKEERDHLLMLRDLEAIDKSRDMFRGHRRIADLLIDVELDSVEKSDIGSGCEESCEVFSSENLDMFYDYKIKEGPLL